MMQEMKHSSTLTVELPDDIILYAFRYCLNRQSYAVSLFIDWLMPYIPLLRDDFKNLLIKEINEADQRDNLGMKGIDDIAWRELKQILQNSFNEG